MQQTKYQKNTEFVLKKKKIYEYRIFPSLLVSTTSITTFEF